MNPLIQLKTIPPLLITLALHCFALLPNAQAVDPPPDGGYPNFTTAEGQNALFSLTSGSANTAVGWFSLYSDTTGSFNTATGAGALLFNTGDQNTAFGAAALLFNTTGNHNTANGVSALFSNTTGSFNNAFGAQALYQNTTGTSNNANGFQALANNTIGSNNNALGDGTLTMNTTGDFNTAIGDLALSTNTTGDFNTATGTAALHNNTTGVHNAANGFQALANNTEGDNNTATGAGALSNNSTGSFNIALGVAAGDLLTTGDHNIVIGNGGAPGESDTIRIGEFQNATYIAGIHKVNQGGTPLAVTINASGRLGTQAPSSRRFKKEIEPMAKGSEAILALKPVTFHYKSDASGTPQFGLIAEQVAEVNPDLVVRDKNGEIYTVRYDAVNAMLLNEFLKEHRKNEKQQKQINVLMEQVKEQAAQIQKVSAQLEASNPAPQMVNNP